MPRNWACTGCGLICRGGTSGPIHRISICGNASTRWWMRPAPTGSRCFPPFPTLRAGPPIRAARALARRARPPTGTGSPSSPVRPPSGTRPGAHTWEIWNEPNIKPFWQTGPDAARYTALLRATASAVRAVDSNAYLLLGGLAAVDTIPSKQYVSHKTFLAELGRLGALKQVDAVSYHPYTYPLLPSARTATGNPLRGHRPHQGQPRRHPVAVRRAPHADLAHRDRRTHLVAGQRGGQSSGAEHQSCHAPAPGRDRHGHGDRCGGEPCGEGRVLVLVPGRGPRDPRQPQVAALRADVLRRPAQARLRRVRTGGPRLPGQGRPAGLDE
ncbi:hypothetical protein E5082_31995 [Streptomyces griseoluteus]|uniref:Glycoside hydrolase family 5 domain-containing protein n=1 Tax=Streptomyces griseoluteus TaxID=29306 RepID=A0A4Z1CWT6_STRGP|nr:hypothetical protein E5082_31995 [Streptomyces griseoluteus]